MNVIVTEFPSKQRKRLTFSQKLQNVLNPISHLENLLKTIDHVKIVRINPSEIAIKKEIIASWSEIDEALVKLIQDVFSDIEVSISFNKMSRQEFERECEQEAVKLRNEINILSDYVNSFKIENN